MKKGLEWMSAPVETAVHVHILANGVAVKILGFVFPYVNDPDV